MKIMLHKTVIRKKGGKKENKVKEKKSPEQSPQMLVENFQSDGAETGAVYQTLRHLLQG
jgi:hypothetical protein